MRPPPPIPDYRFQPMEKGDLAEVIQFWQGMEGIGLSEIGFLFRPLLLSAAQSGAQLAGAK